MTKELEVKNKLINEQKMTIKDLTKYGPIFDVVSGNNTQF